MQEDKEIFSLDDYKIISNFIEKKLPILRQNKDFNKKYLRLNNMIENLENNLEKNQKENFQEIIKLFYETEEYYFILSFSLGLKYGDTLKRL